MLLSTLRAEDAAGRVAQEGPWVGSIASHKLGVVAHNIYILISTNTWLFLIAVLGIEPRT